MSTGNKRRKGQKNNMAAPAKALKRAHPLPARTICNAAQQPMIAPARQQRPQRRQQLWHSAKPPQQAPQITHATGMGQMQPTQCAPQWQMQPMPRALQRQAPTQSPQWQAAYRP